MRGGDDRTGSLFSYVDLEARVPASHPLRVMRALVNASLVALDGSFAALYAKRGRPSIAPERMLRAVLLQMLYSIRSERQLMERLEFDLLFRWFVGLGIDDAVWDASTFSKNRDRLLTTKIAQGFLSALLSQPAVKKLLSAEHFSVDGTMLKAFASMKSFRAKDGPKGDNDQPPADGRNGERDFRKEKRSNETHASTTDPDARLYRKGNGQESRLAYLGHALMENRNGLAVAGMVTHATGTAEREAATELSADLAEGATLCGDKGYDAEAFVEGLKDRKIVPHVAINGTVSKTGKVRKTAVPPQVAQSPGYAISLRCRKRIEEIFGWIKTTAGFTQLKVRGLDKVKAAFTFALAAYNIVRLPKLLGSTGEVCLEGGK
ncbi:putative transposase for insertion sequence NGRIS-8a [Sinorhizobium fredii NGR234]|uniref:Transposase for insertion sequence NGRIS-8a n=1 Tax=Sinorhizobium fredii (strain NBRC 101917 / NGR234) TaxID=394 RepID=C3ME67_SINFN|nr:IS5-like element ISRsp5 family transposase [Sinorhizobium fredii]ACP25736.1 putative transposase for insertion sequence NGRIS-8a [Sinorhizobium fredii NGR234]